MTSKSSLLVSELEHIQRLLGSKGEAACPTTAYPTALLPPVAALSEDGSDSEEDSATLKAARSASQECVRRLRCEVDALKQQLKRAQEDGERRAARAARELEDSMEVVERLQAQLRQQQAEGDELSRLVLALRGENDMLQQHAKEVAEQAQRNEKDAAQGVQQLRAAARQWRQQHEEVMRQLVQEQEKSVALRSELRVAREQQQLAEEALERERKEHKQAIARAAGMEAALGSQGQKAAGNEELIASLKDKLRTERSWRKATQAWLRAELHTKDELERLLINVGTSVRLGTVGQQLPAVAPPPYPAVSSPGPPQQLPPAAPPLYPEALSSAPPPQLGVLPPQQGGQQPSPASTRRPSVAWAPAAQQPQGLPQQMQPQQHAAVASQQQVQQPAYAPQASSPVPADWRATFDATLQSFEARYHKLMQDLALAKHQGLAGLR